MIPLRTYFDALETAAREGGDHAADAVERAIEAHALDMANAVSAKIGELPGWQDNPRSTLDYGTAFAHALRGNVAALLAFEAYSIVVGDKRHTGSFVVASEFIAPAINLSAALAARRAWALLDAYATGTLHRNVLRAASATVPEDFATINRQDAIGKLATKAETEAGRLLQALGDAPETESEALRLVDGMLYADAVFADHLESRGRQGKANATKIRDASRKRAKDVSIAPGERWVMWVDPELASGAVEPHKRTGCRWLRFLLDTLWHDVVQPELEREAKREPARMPVELARAKSYAITHGGTESADGSIQVEAPRGLTLLFDFNEITAKVADTKASISLPKAKNGLVHLRSVLDGAAQRDYLAHVCAWLDAGSPSDGMFAVEDEYILDLTGADLQTETKNGRTYRRYGTRTKHALEKNRAIYQSVLVRHVGPFEAAAGEALLNEYRDRRNGKRRWFGHPRLMTLAMLGSTDDLPGGYARIPRAVCKLPATEVPIGIALGMRIRAGVTAHHNKGRNIEAPLVAIAEEAGVDLVQRANKEGRRAYEDFAARVIEAATRGELGVATVAGAQRDAIVTIKPTPTLENSYADLFKTAKKRAKDKDKARAIRAVVKGAQGG